MLQVARGLATKGHRLQKELKRKKSLPVHHCCLQAPTLNRCLETSLFFTTGPLAHSLLGGPYRQSGDCGTGFIGNRTGHSFAQVYLPQAALLLASQPSARASLLFEKQEAISWSASPDGVCNFPHAHGKSFRSSY